MLFHPDRLSFGIVLPAQTRTAADIEFDAQLGIAAQADKLGFDALWVRDVPLNSESYPDPIGHADPWVLLGALAASTSRIALATGAIVLPLRHPLHIAKAALSVASLSKDRLVLGLGSGDRPSEYDFSERKLRTAKHSFNRIGSASPLRSVRIRRSSMKAVACETSSPSGLRCDNRSFPWWRSVHRRNRSNGLPATQQPG
ncbi:LLM class flavin-dependent oxidoreductase [Rhizobium sp. CNPSo 4062]|uniref:LLM class flavin-dependent oxidoreductase n=1 Tax=Rhizobium sp. CNPSo 4062 TaxID=3021410 RepID=UPI00254A2447|nr:LLM class flavin-dependent oxidoreductase [Rhizobium sp. CNPSo 4062]MDK4706606.1 LLM class flavin-dependent oxidoreductase [Rhizobium sp. CNPSo 4062]